MKLLVEFDVPESWDYYTEEQNLHSLTNWGATNDGVIAKVITDEQIKKAPEAIKLLRELFDSDTQTAGDIAMIKTTADVIIKIDVLLNKNEK